MTDARDIVERLRATHKPLDPPTALMNGGYPHKTITLTTANTGYSYVNPDGPEAADTIASLRKQLEDAREALEFYADETGWNQPPIKTVSHEILGPAYENQASKIRLDRGMIARKALAAIGPLPAPPAC